MSKINSMQCLQIQEEYKHTLKDLKSINHIVKPK